MTAVASRQPMCADCLLLVAKGANHKERRRARCKTPGCKNGPKGRKKLKGIVGA